MKKIAVLLASLMVICWVPAIAATDTHAPVADDHLRDIAGNRGPAVDGPPVDPADIDPQQPEQM